MNYKDTLLMPNTEFEMKGRLKEKDPIFISNWKDNNLYKVLSERNVNEFILHDGPPYANGDIHIGHALNKILKDFIIRNAALNGNKIDWRVGWDTHGLPIELKVQQSGIKLSEVGKEAYLKACFDYALSQVEKQEEQFESLALLTDFNQKYLTLQKEFEARQINVFNKMLNNGLVYQDLKPVYWSWSSETALAEAEIEYKEAVDISIYVKFKLQNSDLNFVIWTTTPWTLPANVAVAYGERIDYSIVELNGEKLVIANELINDLSEKLETKLNILEKADLSIYEGQKLINPVNNNESLIVKGHHVTTEGGTGIVHIAGGHGHDDYIITKENNLELIVVQDDKGHMINSNEYDGMFYLKANKLIANKLIEDKDAILSNKIEHSVPIDWRTKEPVIYRATKQWFVSIDPIKDGLIKEINNVNWYPSWGSDRLTQMTENRSDWCISRQRIWGVPIPIIYDENKKPIVDEQLQANIVKAFEQDGILAWDKVSIEQLLPSHIEYNDKMTKETDILDVWFDSGTSFELLGGKTADVVVEGSDQYRGWFNSSLINSFISNKKAPYKNVITHGFITDSKGNKMSKSLGNTISPMEIIDIYGADILRLWVASTDYQDNPRISDDAIKQVASDYRTIRNSIRFTLGNLSDFDNSKPELNLINKAVLNEINKSFEIVQTRMNEYNFNGAVKEIINQLNNGAIKYFLDYSKDYLYTLSKNDPKRRGAQYVLKEILDYILFTTAPFIPVTVEEAYQKVNDSKGMFFEKTYPSFDKFENINFDEFAKIRNEVNKSIELLRTEDKLKLSTQAEINLTLPSQLLTWSNDLKETLMVAKINLLEGLEIKSEAKVFDGIKCERCWKHYSQAEMVGDICSTCDKVISK